MNIKTILICSTVGVVIIMLYLHYKKFTQTTKKPSIEQNEFFQHSSIKKNHESEKNIYIVRLYSSFDENKKILDTINKINIKAYPAIENKDEIQKLPLGAIVNNNTFPENTKLFMFHSVSLKKVPALDGVFSPLSTQKQIFIHVGNKLQKLNTFYSSHYDRCFLHIIKGSVRIHLYDPSQKNFLYPNN
jgi:hypothetical protein